MTRVNKNIWYWGQIGGGSLKKILILRLINCTHFLNFFDMEVYYHVKGNVVYENTIDFEIKWLIHIIFSYFFDMRILILTLQSSSELVIKVLTTQVLRIFEWNNLNFISISRN